MTPSLGKLLRL